MKQNIILFLKSLVSNNAAIDGARKKPWYAAIIIFFLSIVLSVIPTTVLELKNHADKNFDSTTYGLTEAATEFSYYLDEKVKESPENASLFKVHKEKKNSYLIGNESVVFERYNKQIEGVDFVFRYSESQNVDAYVQAYTATKVSYMIFTMDTVYVSILNPQTHDAAKPVVKFVCINAYKKVGEDAIRGALAVTVGDATKTANDTWSNWKTLIRKLYNQTRLRSAGVQLGIASAINVGITLIMGFMVWVLTRGKNNPYRLFSVWEAFKIAFWAAFCPAMLTTGFGFLIKRFASMIFPMLIGVRVMWLTMKSLRPDGSGYAAN